ncbi:MAG: transcription antitermination factor NusB [bacterium]|nr:transcription antitermination factor NusB [bacterium]
MGVRRRGREISLQILYKIDIRHISLDEALATFRDNFNVKEESWAFAELLTIGVCRNRDEINALVEGQSQHWKLDRMPITDRNIIRIAVYEFLHMDDIPTKVSLNEAIELGKIYGSEESPAFINGILDNIHKNLAVSKGSFE